MLSVRRVTIALRRLRRNRNTSLARRLGLVAVDRACIRLFTIRLRGTAATAWSGRDNNRGLGSQRDGRIPNAIRVDVAVVSPEACDGLRHGGGRQQLRRVVIPDGHLLFGHVPEGRLIQDDGIVQAAEICVCGHLLVARVSLSLRDCAHGFVRVHAEIVEVGEVEAVMLEQSAETTDGGHLVRVDGDDGVVDCGAAAVDTAHVS